MSNQAKTNNLNYLIDIKFTKVNDYLCYHLKKMMKISMTDFLFQNILCQM